MEELRAEVEKKTQMLMEVKGHLREMAEREREREEGQRMVVGERDALRDQVKMVGSYIHTPLTHTHTHTHTLTDLDVPQGKEDNARCSQKRWVGGEKDVDNHSNMASASPYLQPGTVWSILSPWQ